MSVTPQKLVLHPRIATHSPMTLDVRIVREVGFDGMEILESKVRNLRNAGFSDMEMQAVVDGIYTPGIGYLIDIEREGDEEHTMMSEAEGLFDLATLLGVPAVQVLTGPLDVNAVIRHSNGQPGTAPILDLPRDEQLALTARSLAKLADRAAEADLILYLEGLGWAPLRSIADMVEVIERTDRPNVRMIVDFWHFFVAGDQPDAIARIPAEMIYGVHFCDSHPFDGGVPVEANLRNVAIGHGVIDLQAWADAVKATGYSGWWAAELFSKKQQQEDSFDVAQGILATMRQIICSN